MYSAYYLGSNNYIWERYVFKNTLSCKMHPTFTLTFLSSNITKFPSAVPTKRKLLCLLKVKNVEMVTK